MAYRELYDHLSKIAQKYAIKKEPDIIDTIFIILPKTICKRQICHILKSAMMVKNRFIEFSIGNFRKRLKKILLSIDNIKHK
jgi:hypothetical protein